MKKIILFILVFSYFLGNAQEGVNIGGGLAYNTSSAMQALGIQGKVAFGISEKLIANGAYTYYFRKGTYYALDADIHYRLINIRDAFYLNPFAGINLTRTTFTNTSLNLGLSMIIPSEYISYYFESKYIVDDSQLVLAFGFLF